jgi:hypothetical protein
MYHYCEVFQKTIFKPVSGSDTIVSRSAQLHRESISKATEGVSVQLSKFSVAGPVQKINC